MENITESDVEQFAIEQLQQQGYHSLYAPNIGPDGETPERGSFEDVLLLDRLRAAVRSINPTIPVTTREEAVKQLVRLHSPNLIANNEAFHRLLTEGITISYQDNGYSRGDLVWLIDFKHPEKNDFVVANQFTVIENTVNKRPDLILFVNGLPLVVIELKNPLDEHATVKTAFKQLQTYKQEIPHLFTYNAVLAASDGLDARAGSISAGFSRFMAWKTPDGSKQTNGHPQSGLETLIRGMLNKTTLLDVIRHFIVFEKSKSVSVGAGSETRPDDGTTKAGRLRNLPLQRRTDNGIITIQTIKKLASYHQYYAVNRAVESTLRAAGMSMLREDRRTGTSALREDRRTGTSALREDRRTGTSALREDRRTETSALRGTVMESPESYGLSGVKSQPAGDRKGGVVWHTQGSGKSLSMVFYTGKIVLAMENPTVVVITDRNDLDDQLFETFAASKQLLRQEPVQAEDRTHLKTLLSVASGGVVFTTIQKFQPEEGNVYDTLSERRNIIVIADEAHRTHYGFKAKTIDAKDERGEVVGKKIVYGFAKYLRDALPNATYLGFTGTPIEKTDVNTPAVFGNYVDVYDIAQAVEDGATVRIYYESRLAKIALSDEGKRLVAELDDELDQNDLSETQKAKAKWTQLEALVGSRDRLQHVARDIITHFELRQEVFEGKAMIVTMSRRIAAELYREIIRLKPNWHSDDLNKGVVKVVMTSASADGPEIARHHTTKDQRRTLAERMKNPDDDLKLVIVRDMWLTGFDVPAMHTLYIDKPMKGHNLMQAIARVNRVYLDKSGGLVVDYLGIASDLKQALAFYSDSGGRGDPALAQAQAVQLMLEKLEVVSQMLYDFAYEDYFGADTGTKLSIILDAEEHILGLDDGKKRYINEVTALSKAFSIAIPHEQALDVKDEVAFFQAVKSRLVKFNGTGAGRTDEEIDTAIRQVIDKALVTEQVIDVFDAAGIKKPDISILSEEFLLEVKSMEHQNIALEVLKKLLNDEIAARTKTNLIQSKTLMEMLENSIKRYHNKIITAAEVIDELIQLSKDIRQMDKEPQEMGLSEFEYAFYTAVANNDSARELMGKETLRELAVVLCEKIKANASIDWTIRESVKARLKVLVKRTLRQYGYPPDMQKLATETVLKQAELIAEEISRGV